MALSVKLQRPRADLDICLCTCRTDDCLKGLSHEMDLAFDDNALSDLGLNRGSGQF